MLQVIITLPPPPQRLRTGLSCRGMSTTMSIEKETLAVQRSAFMKCSLYKYTWRVYSTRRMVWQELYNLSWNVWRGGNQVNVIEIYPANLILYNTLVFFFGDRNESLALGLYYTQTGCSKDIPAHLALVMESKLKSWSATAVARVRE